MSMKINPPDFRKCKTYERYKQELKAWRIVTEVPKKKQGIAIALSLPSDGDDKTCIREKVFEQIDLEDLEKDEGLETLIAFLDKQLGKDDLSDSFEKFEDFEDYSRSKVETVVEYIAKFDQKYNRLLKLNMTLPSAVLAFKLLKRANITKEERMLVLTGMDFTQKEKLFNQAKNSLKKFLGEGGAKSVVNSSSVAIKLEPAFLADHEEALMAAGYVRRNQSRGGSSQGNWRGGDGTRHSGYSNSVSTKGTTGPSRGAYNNGATNGRPVNPAGGNGKPLLCKSCGSYRHMIAECSDSWENRAPRVNITEEDNQEEAVLFTGYRKQSINQLGVEARNCAVLDSACSSTVCGQNWMDCYLESLDPCDRAKVKTSKGEKVFKFGGGERLKSKGSYCIPAVLAGNEVSVRADVVDSEIPLLLSMDAMKRAKMKLDLENDTAEILGVKVALNHTSSGHYCVPIDKTKELKVESVCAVKLHEMNSGERYKTLLKLHRQFTHPPEKRLIRLMKNAGVWRNEYSGDLTKIYQKCDLCKVYSKTPNRPAVALPMASRFNQKVSMDLKKWRNRWILHLTDMFSRFSVYVFIDIKKPSEVIDKIMTCWIGAAFGVMESILTDNGGEFSSDETREVASILNVEVCTTAAESPFQNGLCERNHAVTDMMLLKMEEQCPGTSIEVLLCWANMAKNALQMWNGYSSYQIVFGKNPNLPNIMSDNVAALEGSTTSEILASHLNALHAARQAFIQSEADERIRRALRSKVRASEQVYENGDRVFYKRDGQERWLGPGKVVFQDGRLVFVRHGGVFVRVSPNRLIKAGQESCENGKIDEEHDSLTQKEDVTESDSDLEETIGGLQNIQVQIPPVRRGIYVHEKEATIELKNQERILCHNFRKSWKSVWEVQELV